MNQAYKHLYKQLNPATDADRKLMEKVGDVIFKLNECEGWMKDIISRHIEPEDTHFVDEILLHNSIVNFGSKMKLVLYILHQKEEYIKEFHLDIDWKALKNYLATMIEKRNALAHSDNTNADFLITAAKMDETGNLLDFETTNIPPTASTIAGNGKVQSNVFDILISEFNEAYSKALPILINAAKIPY